MCFKHKIQLSTWWKAVVSSFYRFVCQSWTLDPWVVLSLLRKVFGLSWCWYIQFSESLQQTCWLPGLVGNFIFLHLPQLLGVPSAFSGNYLEPEFIHFILKALWQQMDERIGSISLKILCTWLESIFHQSLSFPYSVFCSKWPRGFAGQGRLFYLSCWPALWSVTGHTLCSRELGGCSCLWAVVCQVGE